MFAVVEAAPPHALDSVVAWLAHIHNGYPLVGTLCVLMGFDVAVGFLAAAITKTVSSTICSRGMMKKVIILMLVGMCAAIEPYAQGMPLSKLASMAFIVFECTSIVENAARAGLPIPKPILDTLILLKGAEKEKASVIPVGQPPNQTNVTVNRAQTVDIHSDAVSSDPMKNTSDSVIIKGTTEMKITGLPPVDPSTGEAKL